MPQAVDCDLFLYADDTCLLYQHKDLDRINKELTKNFCNICDWFTLIMFTLSFYATVKRCLCTILTKIYETNFSVSVK